MSVWEISWKYHENITSRIQDIYAQYPWWHVDIRWAPPLRPFLQGIAEPQNPTVDPPLLVSPKISGRWMFIPPKWCVYILYIYYNIYITQSYLIRKCITWGDFLPMDHSVGSFGGWKKVNGFQRTIVRDVVAVKTLAFGSTNKRGSRWFLSYFT